MDEDRMTDHLDKARRSWNMSRIRGVNTKPEITVRKLLHAAGFRFRLHAEKLPGKPDIVLPKWNTVIFVHGCFWHRHEGCLRSTTPSDNVGYWTNKFRKNTERDKKNQENLTALGWRVIVIWECWLNNPDLWLDKTIRRITGTSSDDI